MIPTLTTQRLTLRPMTPQDWPAYAALMASDRARHMGGPHAPREAWGMFCSDHAQWSLYGYGALMIDATHTRTCVGQVGINCGPLYPEHELGWLLYPGSEGHGYALEAAAALRDWARHEKHLATLVSYVEPGNDRSRKLAERLGAHLDEATPHPDGDLVFRHFGTSP